MTVGAKKARRVVKIRPSKVKRLKVEARRHFRRASKICVKMGKDPVFAPMLTARHIS